MDPIGSRIPDILSAFDVLSLFIRMVSSLTACDICHARDRFVHCSAQPGLASAGKCSLHPNVRHTAPSPTDWLPWRVTGQKDKMLRSERALHAFRERSGIMSAQGTTQSCVSGQLDGLTRRFLDARPRHTDAETACDQVRNAAKGANLSTIPAVMRAPGGADTKRCLQDAERMFNNTAQRYA